MPYPRGELAKSDEWKKAGIAKRQQAANYMGSLYALKRVINHVRTNEIEEFLDGAPTYRAQFGLSRPSFEPSPVPPKTLVALSDLNKEWANKFGETKSLA